MALIRSYDLSDFCNSPPVDGFFYPTNLQQQSGNNAGVAGKGNCSVDPNKRKEETRNCTVMGSVMSINQPHQPIGQHLTRALGSNPAMYPGAGMDTLGGCKGITGDEASSVPDYLKPVVSGFSSSTFSKQLSLGLNNQHQQGTKESPTSSEDGKDPQSSPEEIRTWTSANDRNDMYRGNGLEDPVLSHPTDDSAPTPVDHIVSTRFTPTISIETQEEDGGSLRLVEKLEKLGVSSCPATPDVTPCSTPAVTPSHSPQVARRAGNPFFTGGSDDSNSGSSWLFRPGKKAGDGNTLHPEKLYEAKIEYQQQPNSKMAKKTVRYVPRPSELRELNFWSPTSM